MEDGSFSQDDGYDKAAVAAALKAYGVDESVSSSSESSDDDGEGDFKCKIDDKNATLTDEQTLHTPTLCAPALCAVVQEDSLIIAESVCTICLEAVTLDEEGNGVLKLPCSHSFHATCIRQATISDFHVLKFSNCYPITHALPVFLFL